MRTLTGAALALLVGLTSGCARLSLSRDAGGVTVRFANGVRLKLASEGDALTGLTDVEVRGRPLRAPGLPAHPVLKLSGGATHAACRIEAVQPRGRGVVVSCRLVRKDDPQQDRLDWIFEPRSERVGGREYVGFAYRYEVECPGEKIDEILDLATWEIGGDIEGKFVQPGPPGPVEAPFRSYRSWVFGSTPWFRFQCGEDGALFDAYESVSPVVFWVEKRHGRRTLNTFDAIQQELRERGGSSFRRIMFCPEAGGVGLACVDEYAMVFDHLERRARDEFGIADPRYEPACLAPQRSDDTFESRIEELNEIAELGFRNIWLCTFESLNTKLRNRPTVNAAVYSLDPAELLGGAAGLGKLAAAARERGLGLITWAPGGQLIPQSEVLKANQDWLLRVPEGKRRPLGGSTDLHSGYYDYAIGKYRELHEKTGIDGVWFDSFNAALTPVQVREDGSRYFQLRKAFEMVADAQAAGLANVQLEGAGPAGQYALTAGFLGPPDPLCYKKAFYVYAARPGRINSYYRYIANKAFPMMPVRYSLWTYEYKALDQFPKLREQVRQANRDWAAVRDLMVRRRLIAAAADPWRDVGVEWSGAESGELALYAYGEFEHPLPGGARVTDVTTGKPVECDGMLRTECCHTYRISAGR